MSSVQAALVENFDDRPNASLGAYPWCGCSGKRTISEEQCRVVGLCELRSFAYSEWADAHSDRDGRGAGARHICALDMSVVLKCSATAPQSGCGGRGRGCGMLCGDGASSSCAENVSFPCQRGKPRPTLRQTRDAPLDTATSPTMQTCLPVHLVHQHTPVNLKTWGVATGLAVELCRCEGLRGRLHLR